MIGGGDPLPAGAWHHDRLPLVNEMARQGAHVSDDVVVVHEENSTWIARLHSARPDDVLATTVRSVPTGTVVTMCTPEHSPVAQWALDHGFKVVDTDTFCATPGIHLPPDLHCLDPGLA